MTPSTHSGQALIRIGTRGSTLALAQTQTIANALAAKGSEVEIIPVTTHGDTSRESLAQLGGTGVFASALRQALRDHEVDVVVHSLKDLPTDQPADLNVAAIPKRADPRDALCARDELTLDTLPQGARVGTGSPRRVAQLKARRPDLEVVDIRGNVDTRLRKVTDGELDAVVLAAAGLERIGRLDAVTEFLGIDGWPTAPGQGALALEVRIGEEKLVAALDHKPTHTIVDAERMVLAQLEAGCAAPVAVHGLIDDGMLFLSGRVYAPDPSTSSGSAYLTASHALYVSDTKTPAADLAGRVAAELLASGAAEIAPL